MRTLEQQLANIKSAKLYDHHTVLDSATQTILVHTTKDIRLLYKDYKWTTITSEEAEELLQQLYFPKEV